MIDEIYQAIDNIIFDYMNFFTTFVLFGRDEAFGACGQCEITVRNARKEYSNLA